MRVTLSIDEPVDALDRPRSRLGLDRGAEAGNEMQLGGSGES